MDYDPIMLTALLGLSASVWAIMEVIKPIFSKAFEKLTASQFWPIKNVQISDTAKFAIWRGLGVVLGIGAVAVVDGVSFLQMWNIYIGEVPAWADVVVTGIVVGLGDRAIHWLVDGIEANGGAIAGYLKGLQNVTE